jgi:AraC-like DNA-binding protein
MRSPSALLREARQILIRHCEPDRLSTSAAPGLLLMRFGWTSLPMTSIQYPCLAMVLQGTKSVEFGGRRLEYGAGEYLLASVDLPAASRIVNADRRHPLLAFAVPIDFAEVKETTRRCAAPSHWPPPPGLRVFRADAPLLDAVVRLLALLDTPEDAEALAPLVRQEILYRLLTGPAGARLIEICRNGSPSSRVADAIAWLREHFAEGFLVEDMARQVGMSSSSLHQHFKAVTGMTPIQYQKRIRLHEARRSLLLDCVDVGEASFRVGYQSHSQFSKDYRHYFGRLPKQDAIAYRRQEFSIEAYTPEAAVAGR